MGTARSEVRDGEKLWGRRSTAAMHRDRDPDHAECRPGGDDRLERVDVAHLVAQDRDRAGSMARHEPLDRFALAAGLPRAQVDHGTSTIVGEPVHESESSFHCLDRVDHGRPCCGHVVSLPDVEGD